MRKMGIILLVIGAVVILVGGMGWFACGGWKAVGVAFEDDASAAQIAEIRVTGNAVAVELREGSDPDVRIHRTARYLNPLHERPGATHRVEGGILYLAGDDSSTISVIEYVVTAPAGVRVTADVGTGSLDLSGASTVDVKVSTGSVAVADATGDVTARVGTGAISLDLTAAADVDATTGTGAVDVTVPAGAYSVTASSGMGQVKLGIPNDPNGEHRIALRTNLGRVTLATR